MVVAGRLGEASGALTPCMVALSPPAAILWAVGKEGDGKGVPPTEMSAYRMAV